MKNILAMPSMLLRGLMVIVSLLAGAVILVIANLLGRMQDPGG